MPSAHSVWVEIDHHQMRWAALAQGGQNVGEAGLGCERHGCLSEADALGAQANLGGRLLAGEVDRAPARPRERRRHLQNERGLADARLASIKSAEPGTMPPPVTRSSSTRPVGMRSKVSVGVSARLCSATALPLEAREVPRPGWGTSGVSSASVFHSPQPGHLPTQRGDTAPQLWHT